MTPIGSVSSILAQPPLIADVTAVMSPAAHVASTPATGGFADMLFRGVRQVEQKLDTADDMVRRLALGEELPIHQASYALEQAQLSVELAMQVRSRLLDGYREIMNLQL